VIIRASIIHGTFRSGLLDGRLCCGYTHSKHPHKKEVNHLLGLGVLFGKLQQGVRENEQLLTIARMRADAEDLYGQHMGDIIPATDRLQDGFQKDDGASVKKVGVIPKYDKARS